MGAGFNNTTGYNNTFLGDSAGWTNSSGNACTFVGHVAGFNNTNAVRCTFVGDSTGYNNTVGRWNTFAGYACGISNVNGEGNSFYGKHCGTQNVNGTFNCYYGSHAGESMIDGNANVMVGNDAGFYQQHGDSNAYVGHFSGYGASAFNFLKGNAFLGASSGYYNFTGIYNTFLGFKAGNDITTNPNNSAAIGANTIVTASDKMILGNNNVNVGIGLSGDLVQFGPQNKLEINADPASFIYTGVGGSGLRFRQLTSNSPTITNPGVGILALNAQGDVIYVPCCATGGGFGALCSGTPSNLTGDFRIGLGGFNYYFDGNAGGNKLIDNVVIGKNCANPLAKLDVLQSSGDVGTIGINVENTDGADNVNNIPVIGIKSKVSASGNQCRKIAGWFEATPAFCGGSTLQFAIITPPNSGVTGLGTFNPTVQLQVGNNGDGTVALANAWNLFSDATLKTNVSTISSALDKVSRLRGVTFDWISSGNPDIGFIAQEVDSVLPVIVYTDSISGLKSLDYGKVVPVLVEAIKELKAWKDSVQNNNVRIENSSATQTEVILTNKKIVLDQNSPNPFKDNTTITYEIKTDFTSALIMFTDLSGDVIKEVPIYQGGKGQLNVFGSDLSSGIYTYYIVVDGVTIDTKKMIKTK